MLVKHISEERKKDNSYQYDYEFYKKYNYEESKYFKINH